MAQRLDRQSIAGYFARESRKPATFNELVEAFGVPRPERKTLKRILRELVREGSVVLTRRGRYGPAEAMELVTGYFEAHAEGYGFVIGERPGERDIFIPARATLSAMDSDRVTARVDNARRRSGRIVRILERAHARLAGTMECAGGACFVKPKRRSISFDLFIPPAETHGARHGQGVIVEIESYPTETRGATGRVLKVLDRPESPGEDIKAIIDEFGLPERFPRGVSAAARELRAARPDPREDLRALHTVTIDGETAKDFDDAISVARAAGGGYTLWVHIADVGHYVGWDTPIDQEARRRATSVYFPGMVIPMLPKELSEDLCSLKPRLDRLAFTVEMRFDGSGARTSARFYPSLINSNERMTYTSVRKIVVDNDTAERERYGYLLADFDLMAELAARIRRRRLRRGSLDFDLPEPEVLLDLTGMPENIVRAERNFAHELIEDFMIAANEAVAEHLEAMGAPSLFRIHEEPDETKVAEVLRLAGRPPARGKDASAVKQIPKVLASLKGSPREEIVMYMVLRSLKQARYSPENAGHFGLASKCYTHFTSPIRRYPDLVVHRILREALQGRGRAKEQAAELRSLLSDIAFNSSRMERVADEAEKEAVKAMRVWLMKDRVGEEFDARVVRVTPNGIGVRLVEYYVEGFLHISSLSDDYYRFDDWAMSLVGKNSGQEYSLGLPLKVRLDRADLAGRECVFGIVA